VRLQLNAGPALDRAHDSRQKEEVLMQAAHRLVAMVVAFVSLAAAAGCSSAPDESEETGVSEAELVGGCTMAQIRLAQSECRWLARVLDGTSRGIHYCYAGSSSEYPSFDCANDYPGPY
jgi:hypothetical protein